MYTREEVYNETLKYFKGDELATNVFFKYCLSDKDGNYLELTPDDMHHRLAKELHRIELKYPNPLSYEEIYNSLKNFERIVPQGSPMFGIGNDEQNVTVSNCYVIPSPEDNLSSIVDAAKNLSLIYKRRGGCGVDISNLRPEGALVSNSAKFSTGAWSFADFYSYVTRMIGQKNRRGALMITIDCRHPDLEKFIVMKKDLKKVTGANVSIKFRDEFMKCVENDEDYVLRWPVECEPENAKIVKTVKAREVWELFTETATLTAEPGAAFWDRILSYMPSEKYGKVNSLFKTITSNPCSEFFLGMYDDCMISSIKISFYVINKFLTNAKFDYANFSKDVRIAIRLLDDIVEIALEKMLHLIQNSDVEYEKELWSNYYKTKVLGRRIGLGTHGLGDLLASLKMKYDSQEALEEVDKIYSCLKNSAYLESVNLAKERGSFQIFDWEIEKDDEFINNLDDFVIEQIKKYGRRNISILTNAPTGSVSVLSQCSSGIEPIFRLSYTRRRKLTDKEKEENVDFVDETGDEWKEFEVLHHLLSEYQEKFKTSKIPDYFVTSDLIDWEKRVELQSVLQKHIDHSISSTINLPRGTKPEIVGNLYFKAWKLGLKGVTVYVEGSRDGVLISNDEKSSKVEKFEYRDSFKRTESLKCDIHYSNTKDLRWVIIVGLVDDKPYEVFGGFSNDLNIPEKYKVGTLKKRTYKTKKSEYDLILENDEIIENVGECFNSFNFADHTRLISLSLRHGAKPSFVAEQLAKNQGDMFSFSKVISRVLKKYVEDGTKPGTEKACQDCKQDTLVYQDGCVICTNCGYSKCS